MAADCGELVSAGPEFDPDLVVVPLGDCTVTPREVEPPDGVELWATVRNDNLFSTIAEVEWVWEGLRIASTEVSVDAASQAMVRATATTEREGRGQVTA